PPGAATGVQRASRKRAQDDCQGDPRPHRPGQAGRRGSGRLPGRRERGWRDLGDPAGRTCAPDHGPRAPDEAGVPATRVRARGDDPRPDRRVAPDTGSWRRARRLRTRAACWSTTRSPGDAPGRARTAGSSLALSMVVVIVVLLIIAAGTFSIFRDDPDDSQAAVIPSPSGTSELVQLGATPTPDGASVRETEAVEGATAIEQTPTPRPTATARNTATSTEEPTATEDEIEE